jgi:wyosine [tRNA(Phe)-imidazoG37] synthetase (radical SAM superfamily)
MKYRPSLTKKLNRRGVMWLGQTCNLRCHFCYFLDKITDESHPEHAFISLEKAQDMCRTLVETYGNNSVDIQGGEPTLYPHIFELVRFCHDIGLAPTLITNAQALAKRSIVEKYLEAGIRDFLVSLQGLGEVYDQIVGRPGAHRKQLQALDNLRDVGIPFRFNCVLSQPCLAQLQEIAELTVEKEAVVINFLVFNPFHDQRTGKRSDQNVPRYRQVEESLTPVLDLLEENNVEANVRYLPLCMLSERHRKLIYNFTQIPYDLHENDFASWSWTDLPSQRIAGKALSSPLPLGPRLKLGSLRQPLRRLALELPVVGQAMHGIKQKLELRWANGKPEDSREDLYQIEARNRSREYCGYRHPEPCMKCDLRTICDGFHGDYLDLYGHEEARPVQLGQEVKDPCHYVNDQAKLVHEDDLVWLEP